MQYMLHLDIYPAGLQAPPTPLAAPQLRLDPGPRPSRKMKSFFWDKLPENRLQKTFWAEHPPSYASLKTDEVSTPHGTLIHVQHLSMILGFEHTALQHDTTMVPGSASWP